MNDFDLFSIEVFSTGFILPQYGSFGVNPQVTLKAHINIFGLQVEGKKQWDHGKVSRAKNKIVGKIYT